MSNLAVPGANGLSNLIAKTLGGAYAVSHDVRTGPAKTVLTTTPTITAGAYTAGKVVGFASGAGNGLFAWGNAVPLLQDVAGGGNIVADAVLRSFLVIDKDSQNAAFDLLLFDSNPTATTVTDNTTLTINSADMARFIGLVQLTTYSAVANCSVGQTVPGEGLRLKLFSQTLYGILINRGTPTYTTTGSLILRLVLTQE